MLLYRLFETSRLSEHPSDDPQCGRNKTDHG